MAKHLKKTKPKVKKVSKPKSRGGKKR